METIKNKNLSQSIKKLIVSKFIALVILVFSISFSAFSQEVDIAKGKALFNANCAACHKLNKNLIGPALLVFQLSMKKNGCINGLKIVMQWLNLVMKSGCYLGRME